jgi:16S rRNA (cytidine1402-2'-O)-methyltransferase
MEPTSLYLVPTPIGNLEDMTIRSLRILKEVDVILAEDTRTSGKLLKHYEINRPLQSYHAYNEHKNSQTLVAKMKAGTVFALITDAGTPGISDPGFLLARETIAAGLKVECLPGATALVPAIVKSGLPSDRFTFEGFLPLKKGRKTRFEELAEESRTMIFYESPHRIVKTLEQMVEYFGAERNASVSREITKMFEETINQSLSEILLHFQNHPPKGEFVVVVEGKNRKHA